MFSSYDKSNYNLELPIKQNWLEHYMYLFQKEVKKPEEMAMTVPNF